MYRYRDILCCLELPESGFAQGNDLSSHSPGPPTTQGSFRSYLWAVVRRRFEEGSDLGNERTEPTFWAPRRKGSVSHCRDVALAPPAKSWIPHTRLRRPPHPKHPVITAEHLFRTLTLRQMPVILIEDTHTLPSLRHHYVHPSQQQKDVPGS